MTEATKIYVKAFKSMELFVSWDDSLNPFKCDEDEEAHLRQGLMSIASTGKWSRDARTARRALKEVAYLKMSNGA